MERSGFSDTLFKFCIQCCIVTASSCSHPAEIQLPQRPVGNTPCPNHLYALLGWQAHYKKATECNALLEKMWVGSSLVMKGNEQELPAEQSPPLLWTLSRALILTQSLQYVTVQQKNNHVSLSKPEVGML